MNAQRLVAAQVGDVAALGARGLAGVVDIQQLGLQRLEAACALAQPQVLERGDVARGPTRAGLSAGRGRGPGRPRSPASTSASVRSRASARASAPPGAGVLSQGHDGRSPLQSGAVVKNEILMRARHRRGWRRATRPTPRRPPSRCAGTAEPRPAQPYRASELRASSHHLDDFVTAMRSAPFAPPAWSVGSRAWRRVRRRSGYLDPSRLTPAELRGMHLRVDPRCSRCSCRGSAPRRRTRTRHRSAERDTGGDSVERLPDLRDPELTCSWPPPSRRSSSPGSWPAATSSRGSPAR